MCPYCLIYLTVIKHFIFCTKLFSKACLALFQPLAPLPVPCVLGYHYEAKLSIYEVFFKTFYLDHMYLHAALASNFISFVPRIKIVKCVSIRVSMQRATAFMTIKTKDFRNRHLPILQRLYASQYYLFIGENAATMIE